MSENKCDADPVDCLTYDALNQFTQVNKDGQLSQYAYNDRDRRIKKVAR